MQYDCLARKIFSDNYNCATTYRKVGQTELLIQEKMLRDYAICFLLSYVLCNVAIVTSLHLIDTAFRQRHSNL